MLRRAVEVPTRLANGAQIDAFGFRLGVQLFASFGALPCELQLALACWPSHRLAGDYREPDELSTLLQIHGVWRVQKKSTRELSRPVFWLSSGAIATVFFLSACGDRHAAQSPPASADEVADVPAAEAESPSIIATAPPWAGAVLQAGDPDELKRYLANVHEIVPTKFKIEWNPATVAFDRDAAMRSLRAVSRDGHRFTLDPGEAAVAKLKPGSILWIYDVTVSKVYRIEHSGGSIIVYTVPVPLNEAIPNAQISFDTRVPAASFMLGRRPPRAPAASAALMRERSSFLRVSSLDPPAKSDAGKPDAGAPGDSNAAADEEQSIADQDAFQGNTKSSTAKRRRSGRISVISAPSCTRRWKAAVTTRSPRDKSTCWRRRKSVRRSWTRTSWRSKRRERSCRISSGKP
ncbi:MAG: hypothetical protein NVS9B2_30540 [Steroidobacteraceae bacterium]